MVVLRRPLNREGARAVRQISTSAGPSKQQLSAEAGDSECDRFLKATRAVIIEVVRESGDVMVGDQDPD